MGATRKSISHLHRVALRQYFQTTDPKPTQAALQAWFENEFGYKISQSIISRSLSDNFANLDRSEASASAYRIRNCQWPWLESHLVVWLHEVESRSGKVANDVIRQKARDLWEQADESSGLKVPQFSVGWVLKFRRRHESRLQCNSSDLSDCSFDAVTASDHHPEQTLSLPSDESHMTTTLSLDLTILDPELADASSPTFSSDHLIHLIQHNVYRALMSNKSLLLSATLVSEDFTIPTPIEQFPTQLCGGFTVIHPLPDLQVPETLYPTPLQRCCAHTGWINMFPFPRFRDNLIKKGIEFVPEQMCQDLFGDIFPDNAVLIPANNLCALQRRKFSYPQESSFSVGSVDVACFDDREDYTAGRSCMINWGDPWRIESWEVTPGFLRKWGWALEGCDELIEASNRWRGSRMEKLINVLY